LRTRCAIRPTANKARDGVVTANWLGQAGVFILGMKFLNVPTPYLST